ncbi:MAG: helix-turn-helix transcriptional regulator [Planctomycetes bacterium]|nr:helix-turn-helix transcriptional regulator [Planctomycetota bacterium]
METYASSLIDGGYHVCTPQWNSGAGYYADSHHLYIPRSGQAKYAIAGREWTLRPGFVYLLPGYQWIRFSCKKRMLLDWLHFRPESLEIDLRIIQFKEGMSWPAEKWSYWKPDYTRWDELFKSRPLSLEYRTQAMLTRMYSDLLEAANPVSDAQRIHIQSIYVLFPAIEFMNRHFMRNPPLKEIAASVHLSPIYFHRSFHQIFRITPHTYQARKRMHFAWDLLRRGGTSVAEASRKLHFANPFYFSRAFKKFFGVAPMEVRMGRVPRPP